MKWTKAKQQLLKNSETRQAYNRFDPIYWIGKQFTNFKIAAKERFK